MEKCKKGWNKQKAKQKNKIKSKMKNESRKKKKKKGETTEKKIRGNSFLRTKIGMNNINGI